MDEIVKQAMAKWPNVPHCYGWLRLDARGAWRMRDEHAQALQLSGDRIVNPVLLDFIRRNYTCDDQGQWYFQNGPQRVYVDLEATPFIARTDPAHGFILHTGEVLPIIDAAWMTENGQFILQSPDRVAMLDDRDLADCLEQLNIDDDPITEDQLAAWLNATDEVLSLSWHHKGRCYPVKRLPHSQLERQFGFISRPSANQARC